MPRRAWKAWGLRQAVVADPEEQRWDLARHIRDVAPADWTARQIAPLPGQSPAHAHKQPKYRVSSVGAMAGSRRWGTVDASVSTSREGPLAVS